DLARRAREEALAELAFQLRDSVGERGLGHEALGGRGGERPPGGQCTGEAKLAQVHDLFVTSMNEMSNGNFPISLGVTSLSVKPATRGRTPQPDFRRRAPCKPKPPPRPRATRRPSRTPSACAGTSTRTWCAIAASTSAASSSPTACRS